MIKSLTVENFKSIEKLDIELGRVTVLIGENGSGKSNILEAIALAGAAVADKLDNEFLASRGIRVTNPEVMRAAFLAENINKNIKFKIISGNDLFLLELKNDNLPYAAWHLEGAIEIMTLEEKEKIKTFVQKNMGKSSQDVPRKELENNQSSAQTFDEVYEKALSLFGQLKVSFGRDATSLDEFLIYSPENSALRKFEEEGQIQPLGIKGEGLFKLLGLLRGNSNALKAIKTGLQVLGWFKDFKLSNKNDLNRRIEIQDKFLSPEINLLDQKSANEGFLFLLFYLALFTSKNTPKFFAIDNIEASFNPKLCEKLMQELTKLAKQFDKQVIFTTHNPSILDGLNLDDPEQILYVVNRTPDGYTKLKRIQKPKPIADTKPTKLSAAFLNGYLGGLPKGF